MTEAAYIDAVYGTCAFWPCRCQQLVAQRKMNIEAKRLCEYWKPCKDKSWDEMLVRLKDTLVQ